MVYIKPYARNIWLNLRNLWEYKWDFFGDFIRMPISIALHLLIFSFLYAHTSVINRYTKIEGFTYILIVSLISRSLSQTGMARIMQQKILRGDLVNDLVLPMEMSFHLTTLRLGYPIYLTVISIFAYTVAVFLFPHTLLIPVWWRIVLTIIFAFTAMLLQMQLYYFIGILTFWLKDIGFISNFVRSLSGFLGGRYIPISWFPTLLLQVALFLPFAQMFYIPVIIFLGKETIPVYLLILQLIVWLVSMQLLIRFTERRGLSRFDGEGG